MCGSGALQVMLTNERKDREFQERVSLLVWTKPEVEKMQLVGA